MTTTSLITLSNITKEYSSLCALQAINMQLAQGEVLGLFGHNGAGKTTMMKLILGVISPTHGNIEVFGVKPDTKAASHMRNKIGYLPENVSFYEQLTGLEVLTYFAKLKGFSNTNSKKHAIALLEKVGVDHAMKRQVKTYSKGMRQRLGLAQAFIGQPKLLLLDEPTVGLDPIATAEFYQTVDQLKSQGTSVILCSHVLPGVEQHIDRAMIISSGQMLATGSLAELRQLAHLPTKISLQGLDDTLTQDPILIPYIDQKQNNILRVPEQDKMDILRHLLSLPNLQDINVEPANLEQVYQYFLKEKPVDTKSSYSAEAIK
ncbi:ABC transporter ATP-binding protein [Thalassotalea profundi]|uniref:Copper ABC transporter ATP-binding protein n=1 Tax=Thalassotalea profundi TaxID=2036687 RepID=A0ABQ3IMG0_9GAMM|nr:ABC transporter ATP-binding protein [Thalassotalea profundi]GHE86330.1 copper ABC transporter ATP-binding protein [Thalassotalea profundi]